MSRIVLASGSPRRKALLESIGLKFEVFRPDVDEGYIPGESPEGYCTRLARTKALAGSRAYPDAVVIAADTIVVIDGQILGKPSGRDDAVRMLKMLEGREHEVITGLAVSYGGNVHVHAEHTAVKFRPLTDGEIRAYVSTGECDDKAGAYAVQGMGSLIVERVRGDYFNVVGLPLCALGGMLEVVGVNLLPA
ncbi:MAG: septum formation inhibitor Maf [Synergistaceae bacterium]|nr:septum formation inhibitor Maf [Synergistaceae bacterium]